MENCTNCLIVNAQLFELIKEANQMRESYLKAVDALTSEIERLKLKIQMLEG